MNTKKILRIFNFAAHFSEKARILFKNDFMTMYSHFNKSVDVLKVQKYDF